MPVSLLKIFGDANPCVFILCDLKAGKQALKIPKIVFVKEINAFALQNQR